MNQQEPSTIVQQQGQHPSRRETSVKFQTVQIRSYDRIVGDHPDVRQGGPPLSIGWDYLEMENISIDDYEVKKKQETSNTVNDGIKFGCVRRLTSGMRKDILVHHLDVSTEDIQAAEAEVERIKKQREQTNKQHKIVTKMEESLQSAKRKMKRPFLSSSKKTMAHRVPVTPVCDSMPSKKERVALPESAPAMPLPRPLAWEFSV